MAEIIDFDEARLRVIIKRKVQEFRDLERRIRDDITPIMPSNYRNQLKSKPLIYWDESVEEACPYSKKDLDSDYKR